MQISEVAIHKRSWKRCAAHVYISHIIQSFEAPNKGVSKESKLNERHEMRTHEGSKRGALSEVHNLNGMRNGVTCATVRNHHESKSGILLQQMQCHYSNMSHAAPRPVCDPQKQVSSRVFLVLVSPLVSFHALMTMLLCRVSTSCPCQLEVMEQR